MTKANSIWVGRGRLSYNLAKPASLGGDRSNADTSRKRSKGYLSSDVRPGKAVRWNGLSRPIRAGEVQIDEPTLESLDCVGEASRLASDAGFPEF